MRGARVLRLSLVLLLTAVLAGACARRQSASYLVIDPATGQPIAAMAQPTYAQQTYARPQTYQPPQVQEALTPPAAAQNSGRGLFTAQRGYRYSYAQPVLQPPSVVQYGAGGAYASSGGPYRAPYAAVSPYGYAAAAPAATPSYVLDSGDRLRIVVFGQDGISNSYLVDAGGNVNLPLIGSVAARGTSTQQLARMIAERLKQGYVREPHVTVDVEAYRPFFILGEVTNPGQYAYVANMTAETAVAIAGGFTPRASKRKVEITRNVPGQRFHGNVPLSYPLRPGDTVVVQERWF